MYLTISMITDIVQCGEVHRQMLESPGKVYVCVEQIGFFLPMWDFDRTFVLVTRWEFDECICVLFPVLDVCVSSRYCYLMEAAMVVSTCQLLLAGWDEHLSSLIHRLWGAMWRVSDFPIWRPEELPFNNCSVGWKRVVLGGYCWFVMQLLVMCEREICRCYLDEWVFQFERGCYLYRLVALGCHSMWHSLFGTIHTRVYLF